MKSDSTRRAFMRETSLTAAAMGSLAAASPAKAEALEEAGGGTAYLCVTCGMQYPESARPPENCPICDDERQYVPPEGQLWTTLAELHKTHKNTIIEEERDLYSINVAPKIGIGQRAFLIRTPQGNVLWDCQPLIDEATVSRIKELGGIAEIAISHPHYYTTMIEWSRAFGGAPIHIHEAERKWVLRPDPCVKFWQGEKKTLLGGLPLIRTGGHFEGYQVLLWPAGAEGKGALMAGDQPQICMDPKQVSFMWSYPNFIPLNAPTIRHVMECLDPLEYDRIYGAFVVRGKGIVPTGGKQVVRRSADRYLQAIHA